MSSEATSDTLAINDSTQPMTQHTSHPTIRSLRLSSGQQPLNYFVVELTVDDIIDSLGAVDRISALGMILSVSPPVLLDLLPILLL